MPKDSITEVLSISPISLTCPCCGATPGTDCEISKGRFAVIHVARIKAAAASDGKAQPARTVKPWRFRGNPTQVRAAKSLIENIDDSCRIFADFLITDAKIALTFLDLAESTDKDEIRSRRIEMAHRAYRSILFFLPRLNPTADQIQKLKREVGALEARLGVVKRAY